MAEATSSPLDTTTPRTRAQSAPASRTDASAPRTVKLSLARIDPWTVLKIAFLLSVAFGIATVVGSFLLWSVVKGMGTFDKINDFARELSKNSSFDIGSWLGLPHVLAFSTVFAVANVVLLTALATLTAVLYNICSALVGGLSSTLSDE